MSIKYAKEGTEFYCVVEYPSGIHRVQKLLAGSNGEFFQRSDGTWMISGMYCRAYTKEEYGEAKSDACTRNVQEMSQSKKKIERLTRKIDSIFSYMSGKRE